MASFSRQRISKQRTISNVVKSPYRSDDITYVYRIYKKFPNSKGRHLNVYGTSYKIPKEAKKAQKQNVVCVCRMGMFIYGNPTLPPPYHLPGTAKA